MAEINIGIPASEFDFPVDDPAEWIKVTGTNGELIVMAFDDATEEYVQIDIKAPDNLDASGSVIFELEGYAATADGNEVRFRISHSAKNEGESWDAAYDNELFADKVTDADPNELDYMSLTVSVADLGWSANDGIRLKLSRAAIADGTPVSGDYYIRHLRIRIPTS